MTERPKYLARKRLVRHEPGDEVVRRLQEQHVVVVLQGRAHAILSQLIITAVPYRPPYDLPPSHSRRHRRCRRRIAVVRGKTVAALGRLECVCQGCTPGRDDGALGGVLVQRKYDEI